jgi:broad specificity phosphatase PhoE
MSAAAVECVLVRHGETDYNREGRLQGALPPGPPLNGAGRAQAEAVRRRARGARGAGRRDRRAAPPGRDAACSARCPPHVRRSPTNR